MRENELIPQLRIGNLLECDGSIVSVTMITENAFSVKTIKKAAGMHTNGGRKTPIPLTPEILETAGFHKNAGIWAEYHLSTCGSGGIEITFSNNGEVFCAVGSLLRCDYSCDRQIDAEIKYLHQLQNLYFALTNTELTLTPATKI